MNFDLQTISPMRIAWGLICILAMLTLFAALEQMERSSWERDYNAIFAAYRIWIVVMASAAGFALGWFLSPGAAPLRAVLSAVGLEILVWIALHNNGLIGWGLSIVLANMTRSAHGPTK